MIPKQLKQKYKTNKLMHLYLINKIFRNHKKYFYKQQKNNSLMKFQKYKVDLYYCMEKKIQEKIFC